MNRIQLALAAIAVLLLGFLGGYGVRAALSSDDAAAEPNATDIGFAQDMSVHHQQAVLMSGLILDTADQPVRTLAWDILTTQQNEIGQMHAWLEGWNEPFQTDGELMAWMGSSGDHGGHHDMSGMDMSGSGGALMPGMATNAELERLKNASGPDKDILFLQLMLRHHEGGAPMAEYAVENADLPRVQLLAEKMVKSQGAEVNLMKRYLAERGAAPL